MQFVCEIVPLEYKLEDYTKRRKRHLLDVGLAFSLR